MIIKNSVMKKLNILLMLLLAVGSINLVQGQSTIPWRNTGTKTKPTTTQPAAPQPMQVTPKANTGMVIGGVANTFSNPSYTYTMPDNTRVTTKLVVNPQNANSNFGGSVRENIINSTPSTSNASMNCVTVTKTITAESASFMNSNYSSQSPYIYPGAIYRFTDFFGGTYAMLENGRNPIEVSTDNLANSTGPVFRQVAVPTANNIRTEIANILRPFENSGGGRNIQYRVYSTTNDAELTVKANAGGGFAGFKASGSFSTSNKNEYYYLTIDAIMPMFTLMTSLPANGYFSDKSIESNNKDLIVIQNVVYGCRVLANVEIKKSSNQDDVNFKASFESGSINANAAFDYLKKSNSVTTTVNGFVVGGPEGTTMFNKDRLFEDIQDLLGRATYKAARPIAFTLTDVSGRTLGIQTATDQYTEIVCTPKSSLYKLVSARVEVNTGSNDPKNDGSKAYFKLFNSLGITVASSTGNNNIEFPVNSFKSFDLVVAPTDERYGSMPGADALRKAQPANLNDAANLESFKSGYLDITFDAVQIGLGWDEWQITRGVVYLQFQDQNGAGMPPVVLNYNNLNVYLKKDRGTLRLPFNANGGIFSAGGAFQQ
jgi:hypothetical protein